MNELAPILVNEGFEGLGGRPTLRPASSPTRKNPGRSAHLAAKRPFHGSRRPNSLEVAGRLPLGQACGIHPVTRRSRNKPRVVAQRLLKRPFRADHGHSDTGKTEHALGRPTFPRHAITGPAPTGGPPQPAAAVQRRSGASSRPRTGARRSRRGPAASPPSGHRSSAGARDVPGDAHDHLAAGARLSGIRYQGAAVTAARPARLRCRRISSNRRSSRSTDFPAWTRCSAPRCVPPAK